MEKKILIPNSEVTLIVDLACLPEYMSVSDFISLAKETKTLIWDSRNTDKPGFSTIPKEAIEEYDIIDDFERARNERKGM